MSHYIRAIPIACSLLLPLLASGAGYLKIGDIKGESTDSEHKDWIIIESYSFGLDALDPSPLAKRQHRPFTAIKPIDKATPLLMQEVATGGATAEAIFEVNRSGLTPSEPYLQVRMKDVHVTASSTSGDTDSKPYESIELNFPYAAWHYQRLDVDGQVTDKISTYYDMELNEGGVITSTDPKPPIIGQVGNKNLVPGESTGFDLSIEDPDTPAEQLVVTAEADPDGPFQPEVIYNPESRTLNLKTAPFDSGQTTITVTVSDGALSASMSFTLYVDSSGTPFEGFMSAYFNTEDRLDTILSSPLGDPDRDFLPTLLEFLFGTNPREYTRPFDYHYLEPTPSPDPAAADAAAPWGTVYLYYFRRIDEPAIRLTLYGSPDGVNWTQLTREGVNPLYAESSTEATNPLFEEVTGSINPPDGASAYFVRFHAEWN